MEMERERKSERGKNVIALRMQKIYTGKREPATTTAVPMWVGW